MEKKGKFTTLLAITGVGIGLIALLRSVRAESSTAQPILSGEGEPTIPCDINGQVYVDITTGTMYVCNGSTGEWEPRESVLIGPMGRRGSLWDSGEGLPLEEGDELAGDQYLDIITGEVYEFA